MWCLVWSSSVAAFFKAAALPVIAAFKSGCLGQICLNACAIGVCSSSAQCKDDEASEENGFERHDHAHTPKLKSVPEWFEQEMPRNDTKFQAQPERANFCSFPIENVKGAQIETNSEAKLSKNMWLQTSDWHISNSWAPRQQDAEEIDEEAMTGQKDKGT